jgi:hypothetical protein
MWRNLPRGSLDQPHRREYAHDNTEDDHHYKQELLRHWNWAAGSGYHWLHRSFPVGTYLLFR